MLIKKKKNKILEIFNLIHKEKNTNKKTMKIILYLKRKYLKLRNPRINYHIKIVNK